MEKKLSRRQAIRLAAAAAGTAVLGSALPAKAAPAGWNIKVCADKTTSVKIEFLFGQSKSNASDTYTWEKGKSPNEFDVPGNGVNANELYIRADVFPSGRNGHFCVMWQGKVAKYMNVNKKEDHTIKQKENDRCPC
jgi:hypothetical protein